MPETLSYLATYALGASTGAATLAGVLAYRVLRAHQGGKR